MIPWLIRRKIAAFLAEYDYDMSPSPGVSSAA